MTNIQDKMGRILSAADAKTHFAAALRRVEGGEPVVITRYGKPVAALVEASDLERLERLSADAPGDGGEGALAPESSGTPGPRAASRGAVSGERPAARASPRGPTPEELLERAVAPGRRRVDYDLARAPAELRPILQLIRENFHRRGFNVRRVRSTLGLASHDTTTRFRRALGSTIGRYIENRRLEAACRLLVDENLDLHAVARLTGYGSFKVFSRAFDRRLGCRPKAYRDSGGRLSRPAARDLRPGELPPVPRFLAGFATLPGGARCRRCGADLETGPTVAVFEDLAPICAACAAEHAPSDLHRLASSAARPADPGPGSPLGRTLSALLPSRS